MKYYTFKELVEKTGFSDNTIRTRLYNYRVRQNFGVELINGHYMVSEENFYKYNWDKKSIRGKKA